MSDLRASYVSGFAVQVSWTPPQSLQGVPILGYNVTVTNANSGTIDQVYTNGSQVMPNIRISGGMLQACHDFVVTVVAINEVGSGNTTSVLVHNYPGGIWGYYITSMGGCLYDHAVHVVNVLALQEVCIIHMNLSALYVCTY